MGSEVSDDTRNRKNLVFWFDAYATAYLASAHSVNSFGCKHASRHSSGVGCRYLLVSPYLGRLPNVATHQECRSKAASDCGHTGRNGQDSHCIVAIVVVVKNNPRAA